MPEPLRTAHNSSCGTDQRNDLMFLRLLYVGLLIVVAAGLWVQGGIYLEHVRSGRAGTAAGLLELAYLLTIFALGAMILRSLLRAEKARFDKEVRERSDEGREVSFSESVVRLQTAVRRSFVQRPVFTLALLLISTALLASIPILLVALGTAGGLPALGRVEWLGVGLAELPILLIVIVVVIGVMSVRDPS